MENLFNTIKPVIGVVHLQPLPGSAHWDGNFDRVLSQAEKEAVALASGGVSAIIIENYNDIPFEPRCVNPAVVSSMSIIVKRISQLIDIPIGISVLRNDAESACAIAYCAGAKFIRVSVLTGAVITDSGFIEGCASALLKYRELIKASDIHILADVMPKHGSPAFGNYSLANIAEETVYRGLADGIVLCPTPYDEFANIQDIIRIKEMLPQTPLFIGSGVTIDNVEKYLSVADGAIVGTSLKTRFANFNAIDITKVEDLVYKVNTLRKETTYSHHS